jgi:hypothetical protein
MIGALATGAVHPASVWTGDLPDLPPTLLTLPARFSPHGLIGVEEWNFDVAEQHAIRRAAERCTQRRLRLWLTAENLHPRRCSRWHPLDGPR